MYSILQYRINIAQLGLQNFSEIFFPAFVPDAKKSEYFLLIRAKIRDEFPIHQLNQSYKTKDIRTPKNLPSVNAPLLDS